MTKEQKDGWLMVLILIGLILHIVFVFMEPIRVRKEREKAEEVALIVADLARMDGIIAGFWAAKTGRNMRHLGAINDALKYDRGTNRSVSRIQRAVESVPINQSEP